MRNPAGSAERLAGKEIGMKAKPRPTCEKCGTDLVDEQKSNANWQVFSPKCPTCGHRFSAAQMVELMLGKNK